MSHKCEDCANLKKRHGWFLNKEYFRKCVETEEFMSVEDTTILHSCKAFKSLAKELKLKIKKETEERLKLEKQLDVEKERIQQLRNEEERIRAEEEAKIKKKADIKRKEEERKADIERIEQERLRKWRKKMKDRWKKK